MADNNHPRHRGQPGEPDDDNESRRALGGPGGEFDDNFDDNFDDDLDDDFADDDLDDDLDDEDDEDPLLEVFRGDDFRVVSLQELTGLDDIEEEALPTLEATLTLEEVLYRLLREEGELPSSELAVFSDLPPFDADEVRRVWPQIDLLRRRVVAATVADQSATYAGMDYGAFLRVLLDDSDAMVRSFAIEGLGEEGAAPDLLGRYIQALGSDQEVEVRAAAAGALGAYILEGELEELDSALAMRAEQALMAVLANRAEPVAVQCRALESIAFSGELGVRQLIEDAYYAPEDQRRLSALVAMGRSADIHWRRLARAELTSPDPLMRAQAAYTCGELEARSALSELLALLQDPDRRVRLAAMFALGHIGGPEARDALQNIFDFGDEEEAAAAEEALEEMDFYAGVEAAAVPLFDESEDEDEDGAEPRDWENGGDEDEDLGEYE